MKKIFLIGLLLCFFSFGNAQKYYYALARRQAQLGNYQEAIRLESEALKILEETVGNMSPDYAKVLNSLATYYYHTGNYQEAIRLETEALNIQEEVLGKKHPDYATFLNNLALYYSKLGNYQEAILLGADALKISEEVLGKEHPDYVTTLNNLALYNSHLGNYQEALRLGTEALNLGEKIHGKNHPDYANSLSNLAEYYYELGNYQEALQLGTEAMNIREKILGKNHPDYATSLNNLANLNSQLGDYREAIRLGTEALSIYENVLGTNNSNYASTLSNLALYNSYLGNYMEAIRLGTESMNIGEKIFGKNHPKLAITLNNIALYNYYLGNYQEAIRLGTDALNTLEKGVGKNNYNYTTFLSNLALYNSKIGNYKEAIRLGTDALNLREKILGKKHPDYATSLSNLSVNYDHLGDYQEAIRTETEALKIIEEVLGKKHPNYVAVLSNLALYNFNLGDYQEAIRLGSEALDIREKIHGKYHPDYATTLSNLAEYYYELGNYQEAIKLGTEALNIREKILGKNHPDYATSLNNLANHNSHLGNYQEAIRLGTEALNIYEKGLGKDNSYYATSLNNLALLNFYLGNCQEAIRLGIEAMNIHERVLGTDHPLYPISLNNLALFNFYLGNYQEATRLGIEAMNIHERILGEKHPVYVKYLSNLGLYYYFNDDLVNLKKTEKEDFHFKRELLLNSFSFLPLSEREAYWNANNFWYIKWLPAYTYTYPDADFIDLGYNAALLSKGILLNSEIEFDKFLAENGTPELADKYNEVKRIRMQLNKLYEMPIANRWCDTDSLEGVAIFLERELMSESKEFGDYTRNLSITWQDVQKGLSDKEVAIEFVSFPLNQDSTMYVAYVLKQGMDAPVLVKLFEEKDLKSGNIFSSTNPDRIYTQKWCSELIWGKFAPYLEDSENVYFAPDGLLHQIAIEYLPALDGEGMMSDIYNIYRLSSTRQLAIDRDRKNYRTAVLYGGIEYNSDPMIMLAESRKYDRGSEPLIKATDPGIFANERFYASPLAGTLPEAQAIKTSLDNNGYSTTLFSGSEASEESFKNLSGENSEILHIATHGVFWNKDEAEKASSSNPNLFFMDQFGENGAKYSEDKALTRSWLFMAGANNTTQKGELPEGVENGLLTAQEIAQMNLRGTDLVVLSACQTGLGDIGSEGVFGLQRGFKKAGVNTILMSLWNVNDDATQLLMTTFYDNYMKGMSKREALKEAQRTVRETPGYNIPRFWAPFILLDGLE